MCCRSTLIAPLEQWRRFELAVAVGIGEVLSEEIGESMQISVIGIPQEQPIIQCGRFGGLLAIRDSALLPSDARAI